MKLVRMSIWLATGFFVAMLFLPLVREMLLRLRLADPGVLP